MPVPILLDTDIGPDCDDAGAIAVLHALADRGEALILGMVCNTTSPWGAPCLQAINAYFGRAYIPVGTLKGPGNSGSLGGWNGETYNRHLALGFLSPVAGAMPDALDVYRDRLAHAGDGEVVVVSIGHLTNLQNLLLSGPDHRSPLTGRELIERKVQRLVIMGGRYPAGQQESNFLSDPPAAQCVAADWPTPITFVGAELGEQVLSGARLQRETAPHNPIRIAYERWDSHFMPLWQPAGWTAGTVQPHASHDQIALLYAVRGLRNYWTAGTLGLNAVLSDGSNEWQPAPGGRHIYLEAAMPALQLAAIIEDLMIAPARRPEAVPLAGWPAGQRPAAHKAKTFVNG